jgi:hypothetical protein
MKIWKLVLASALMLTLSNAVNAAVRPDSSRNTLEHAVNTYIAAVTRGKLDGINDIIDDTAAFSLLQGAQENSYSKWRMLKFLAESKNVVQDCTAGYTILQKSKQTAVVKVDMLFEDSVRTNYVTFAYNDDDWKIIFVYMVFARGRN